MTDSIGGSMRRIIWGTLFVCVSLLADTAQNGNPAMEKLNEFIKGNANFADDSQKMREKVKGKNPEAIVFSCSDSPFSPESVFDQSLGTVYSVRNSGHVADSASIASMEHAIQNMGVKLLVVLGHESCGAVRTAITASTPVKTNSKEQNALFNSVKSHLQSFRMVASNDSTLRPPVSAHVAGTAMDLLKRSKIIKKAADDGTLLIAEGIYSNETGKVELLRVGRTAAQGLINTPPMPPSVEEELQQKPIVLKKKPKVLPKVVEKHEENHGEEHAEHKEHHEVKREVAEKVEVAPKKVEESKKVESQSAWGE